MRPRDPFPEIGAGECAVAIPLGDSDAKSVSPGSLLTIRTRTFPHGFPRYAYAVARRGVAPIPGIPYGKALALFRVEYVERSGGVYSWLMRAERILGEPIPIGDLGISSMEGAEWRYAKPKGR